MSTLPVPLPRDLEEFIDSMVKSGKASNKADAVCKALKKYAEDQAIEAVLRAEQEAREGKVLKGDLQTLLKKIELFLHTQASQKKHYFLRLVIMMYIRNKKFTIQT